jgi:acetyl esterase/lipase
MSRKHHYILAYLGTLLGCGDDLPNGVLETTAQDSTSSGSNSSGGDGTADETGTGNPAADGAPCDFDEEIGEGYYFEPPAAQAATLNGEDDCDFENILGNNSNYLSNEDSFQIWIYRPQEDQEDSDWPEGRFPVVFMSPGGNQRVHLGGPPGHRYLPMFDAIARSGFVVIAIEPDDTDWSSGRRRAALACAMIWVRDNTELLPHMADTMTILGHSRGGGAAWLLTRDILADTNLPPGTSLGAWSQCATVAMAQSFDSASSQDPTITNLPINDPATPPFLAVQGSIDEDTRNQQISAFDNRYSEAFIDAQTSQPDQNDELFLLAYGRSHNSWGGTNLATDDLITPYYVPEFLRWQIMGEQERRAMLVAPMAWNADSNSFPDEIATSPTWTSEINDIFYSGCEGTPEDPCPVNQAPLQGLSRPLIYASYTQGVTWNGTSRFALDLFEEGQSGPYCEDFGLAGTDLPLSTSGGYVIPEATPTGNAPSVCEGPASSLLTGIGDSTFDGHETGAMLVQWGGALGGASIRWGLFSGLGMVPSETATATHLSFRIGNVLTDDAASCDALLDEVTVRVELRDANLDGPGPTVTVSPIIDPQSQFVFGPATGNLCRAAQFMHTVRIPMLEFCNQAPVAIDNLTELVFHFDDDDQTHVAMLDSLEFTHDPFLPGHPPNLGECSQRSASWNCVATNDLTVTETSCTTEPVGGACPSMSQTTNSVPLPTVPNGVNPYSGWIAHTPAGWISDPDDPTQADLDRVLVRCIEACELEWSNNPDVMAACSATDAFQTPTLRQSPALGSEHRIPNDARDGSGLFTSQSLACDLERDCCTEFDEDVCPSKPFRPTSVDLPLGRGEEILVNVGTSASKVTFITPGASVAMPLVGEAGYSRCRDGGTCPFYVGSLAVTGTSTVNVSDTCPDSSAFSATVTDFDLELLQPAFGIADAGSNDKAFPTGALHLRGTITVAGTAYTIRAVNEQPVYLTASGSGFFAADLDIDLDVPCGAGTMPVTLQIDLRHDGTPIGQPPTIGIATPSTFSCPTMMTLTSTASDPDADLVSVRWYVDDVLLAPSVTTLPMTGAHTLRAVARDARGAATPATKSVACL